MSQFAIHVGICDGCGRHLPPVEDSDLQYDGPGDMPSHDMPTLCLDCLTRELGGNPCES